VYHGIVVRTSFEISELLSFIVPSSRLSSFLSLQAGNLGRRRQDEYLKVIRNFKHLPFGPHRPEFEFPDRRITHAVSGNITARYRTPSYTIVHHTTPYHTMAPPSARNHSGELPSFFSLPCELRDEIYDILHQHEEELSRGQLTFSFPLTHLRHISPRVVIHTYCLEVSWMAFTGHIAPTIGSETSPRDYLLEVKDPLISLMCLVRRSPHIRDVRIHLYLYKSVHREPVDVHLCIRTMDRLERIVDELIACPVLADSIANSLDSSDPTVTVPGYFADWSLERGLTVSDAKE
jgi:hypothetical protein